MKTRPGPSSSEARSVFSNHEVRDGTVHRLSRVLAICWRRAFVAGVEHEPVVTRIRAESGWSGRYAFTIAMSVGIAASPERAED